jgi:hypothetical protein
MTTDRPLEELASPEIIEIARAAYEEYGRAAMVELAIASLDFHKRSAEAEAPAEATTTAED